MNPTNASPWLKEHSKFSFPALESDLNADVVIIGGGIVGLVTAYYLSKQKKKVVLIDKKSIASGMTSITTAFITSYVDAHPSYLKSKFGNDARLVLESSQTAIDEIERIIKEENIDCEFKRVNAYIFANNEKGKKMLEDEAKALEKIAPKTIQWNLSTDNDLDFKNQGYLKFNMQAKFHPIKFMNALLEKVKGNGVEIFENTEATDIKEENNYVEITANGHKIKAGHAVIATYSPITGPAHLYTKLISYQTYVIEAQIPKGTIAESIYWDTEDPYNYFRIDPQENFDRIILGGRDQKTGESMKDKKPFDELEKLLLKLIKGKEYKVVNSWSGQIIDTIDHVPYIGAIPTQKGKLIATGFSGNGMTYGVLSAMIMSGLILAKENRWADFYDPKRFHITLGFIEQSLNYIKEMIIKKEPEDKELEEVEKDSGWLLELNGKKVAIYKDENGNLVKLSPICTHLGCTVGWNSFDKTWDCPCHGSRFDKNGEVINGPAQKPLNKVE